MLRTQKLFKRRTRPTMREPDLTSLINIVFLILIFFIVAGTLRPFSARDLELSKVSKETAQPAIPSTLIAHADGRVTFAGRSMEIDQLGSFVREKYSNDMSKTISIVADGRLAGSKLLAVSRSLREAGVNSISVMVEKERQ